MSPLYNGQKVMLHRDQSRNTWRGSYVAQERPMLFEALAQDRLGAVEAALVTFLDYGHEYYWKRPAIDVEFVVGLQCAAHEE